MCRAQLTGPAVLRNAAMPQSWWDTLAMRTFAKSNLRPEPQAPLVAPSSLPVNPNSRRSGVRR
jgi:hypothetical protein